jgi:hypothetical protein
MAASGDGVVDIDRRIAVRMVKYYADGRGPAALGFIAGNLRFRYPGPYLAFRLDQL